MAEPAAAAAKQAAPAAAQQGNGGGFGFQMNKPGSGRKVGIPRANRGAAEAAVGRALPTPMGGLSDAFEEVTVSEAAAPKEAAPGGGFGFQMNKPGSGRKVGIPRAAPGAAQASVLAKAPPKKDDAGPGAAQATKQSAPAPSPAPEMETDSTGLVVRAPQQVRLCVSFVLPPRPACPPQQQKHTKKRRQ